MNKMINETSFGAGFLNWKRGTINYKLLIISAPLGAKCLQSLLRLIYELRRSEMLFLSKQSFFVQQG